MKKTIVYYVAGYILLALSFYLAEKSSWFILLAFFSGLIIQHGYSTLPKKVNTNGV